MGTPARPFYLDGQECTSYELVSMNDWFREYAIQNLSRAIRCLILATAAVLWVVSPRAAQAQLQPEIGFVHPAGARLGTTVNVILGGYDWTPDVQLFVHDSRIKLELTGPPSPVLVPGPPYWFGAKARGPAWPLAREFPARLTIPADVRPGLIRWQVANANGASPVAVFHVGDTAEILEDAKRTVPQLLPALPITVSGQIGQIEEIDEYEFRVPKDGPVTVELVARKLGSPLHGIVQVHEVKRSAADDALAKEMAIRAGPSGPTLESAGRVVDAADSEGRDLRVTFFAKAAKTYRLRLHDVDFAGDRSYVYRLVLKSAPQVLACYPSAGRRGETRQVEFVGIGVATGSATLESVVQDVTFPSANDVTSHEYALATAWGTASPYSFLVTNLAEQVESSPVQKPVIELPVGITGTIETRWGTDTYCVNFKKDQMWRIAAQNRCDSAPLDLDLAIMGSDGKQVAASEDDNGSTDPAVSLVVPTDGTYRVMVSDRSGKSGSRAACYRLSIQSITAAGSLPGAADFTNGGLAATFPSQISVPLGGQAKLAMKFVRDGGSRQPISLTFSGLPAGVTVPPDLNVPADKDETTVDLNCGADAPAIASLATVTATTTLNERSVTRPMGVVLIATVMKPRCKITPDGLDDVRKVHRGSTFLAPLTIERLEGFQGEVVLEMTSKQQRHRQGLGGGELTVPPGVQRMEYPIFVPEWMETTKTSRMILNGVVQAPDPRGNIRTLVNKMELRIGILPEGALLKVGHTSTELTVIAGAEIQIPLTISRAPEFREKVVIELVPSDRQQGMISADPLLIAPESSAGELTVRFTAGAQDREQLLSVRASGHGHGKWPVVSTTTIPVSVKSGALGSGGTTTR